MTAIHLLPPPALMPGSERHLLIIWALFGAMAVVAVVVVLVWAVRTRQFAHQDRARHLPLRSGIPHDRPPRTDEAKDNDNKDQNPRP